MKLPLFLGKTMKRLICIGLIFVLILSFTACDKGYNKYTDYTFDYFDTAVSIIGYEKEKQTFDENCTRIKEKLDRYHKLYNIYARYEDINNIYTINHSETSVEVDREIIDMLKFSKEMYDLTGGQVNVAMGSVLSLWHDARTEGLNNPEKAQIPDFSKLSEAFGHTSIDDIVLGTNSVEIKDKKVKLDVGAVAKGYATEQVALWMEKEGIIGYLLNVGGNIRIVGKRPDGKKWQIGLENPDGDDENPYTEYLELEKMCIVTSGSYQRFYTVNGKDYHHIIDPDTLMPAKGYKMVSIITKDSGVADALSTALFCMDYDEGNAIIDSMKDAYAMWVLEDGGKLYSKGFERFIKS